MVAPFVVAPHLQLHSGSPDGRYIAFWQSDSTQPLLPNAPMRLRFYDIKARRLCEFPFETNPQLNSGWMGTVEEFKFIADIDTGGPMVGLPCDSFSGGDWGSGGYDGVYSPSYAAWANTFELTRTNGILTLNTVIAESYDPAITDTLASYTWSIDERLGELGMGGQWVSDETFLIYETREFGPALLKSTGEIIPLIPNVMGTTSVARPHLHAQASVNTTYHILLSAWVGDPESMAQRLYHGNTGRTEALPQKFSDGRFSPNGHWLTLRADDGLWLRSADTTYPIPRQISTNADNTPLFSPDESRFIIVDEAIQALKLISLPDFQTLAVWQLGSSTQHYSPALYVSVWSPDGSAIFVYGNRSAQADSALFVLQPD